MKMFIPKYFILVWLTIFIQQILQAQGTIELVGDRPDQTESSITVPHQTLQIESGFMFMKNADEYVEFTHMEYNGTLLRYGLLKFLELRFGAGFEGNTTEILNSTDNPAKSKDDGISPLSVGFKVNLFNGRDISPHSALIFEATIPHTGKSRPVKPDPFVLLACSNPLTHHVDLGYNIGVATDQENHTANGFYSLVFGFGAGEKLGFFAETFGTFLLKSGDEWSVDGGMTYLLRPNLQFDLYGGFGLNQAAPDYFIGTGLIYRIPR